jgi:hypothetical protein
MILVCVLAAPSMAHAAPKQLTVGQVQARIRHIGVGNLVGVQLASGVAYAGRIVSVDAQSFGLERYGEEQATPVAYHDVAFLQERLSMAYLARRPVTPETVHARLLKRGLGNWVGVQLLNGVAFCGSIVSIDENSFGLQLYGDSQVTPVAYSDVVYIQTGLTGGEKALIIVLPAVVAGAGIGTMLAMRANMPKMPTMPAMPTQPIFPVY